MAEYYRKRSRRATLLLPLLAALAMVACAGKAGTGAKGVGDGAGDGGVVAATVDSLGVLVTVEVAGIASLSATEQGALAQFMGEQLLLSDETDPDDSSDCQVEVPPYEGDLRAFLQQCAEQKWEDVKSLTFDDGLSEDSEALSPEELAASLAADGDAAVRFSSCAMRVQRVYSDATYVSYEAVIEDFIGAAAGLNLATTGITLRRGGDGAAVGYDLLGDTSSDAFQSELTEALFHWVEDVLELPIESEEDLRGLLVGEIAPGHLPLPRHAPYLTAGGVVLPYQADELIFSREPQLIVVKPSH